MKWQYKRAINSENFLLGVCSALALVFLIVTIVNTDTSKKLSGYAVEFATIAAAALVAFYTLRGIRLQIEASFVSEREALARKQRAARAGLAHTLSSLYQKCERNTIWIIEKNSEMPHDDLKISADEFEVLFRNIEYSSSEVADVLTEIAAAFQIAAARTAGIDDFLRYLDPSKSNLKKYEEVQYIRDWITIKSIITAIFPFSRGNDGPISRDEVRDIALRNLEYVASVNGTALISDKVFRDMLDLYKEKDSFSFTEAGWSKR